MAEEDKPEVVESTKKDSLFSKTNIIIFTVVALVLGVVAFIGMNSLLSSSGDGEKKEEPVSDTPGPIFEFDPIVVNISGTQGTRYLKVTAGVELDKQALEAEMTSRKIQFTDILNRICSSKTLKEIDDPAARLDIKREIKARFNEVLRKGKNGNIKAVFFSDFVVQ